MSTEPQLSSSDGGLGSIQRSLILKTFPGFVDLSAAELAVLAAITEERFFARGAALLEPGVPVQAFYLIVEGEVQVLKDGTPTQTFGPRSAVGGLAALTRDPAGAHVVALEDTVALEVDHEDMADVFEDHFPILLGVLRAVARTLREAQIRARGGPAMTQQEDEAGPTVDTSRPLGLVERMWQLRRGTAFRHTNIEALADMATDAEELRFAAGETVWDVGDQADWSLLVVSGTVRCESDQAEPFTFGPGYVVGGLDSLAEQDRWYRATAECDVVGLRTTRADLYDVLEDHPDMSMAFLRNLAAGIIATMARIAAMGESAEASP